MTLGFALYWFAQAKRGSEAIGIGDVVAPAAKKMPRPCGRALCPGDRVRIASGKHVDSGLGVCEVVELAPPHWDGLVLLQGVTDRKVWIHPKFLVRVEPEPDAEAEYGTPKGVGPPPKPDTPGPPKGVGPAPKPDAAGPPKGVGQPPKPEAPGPPKGAVPPAKPHTPGPPKGVGPPPKPDAPGCEEDVTVDVEGAPVDTAVATTLPTGTPGKR